jgi:aspartate racemase
VLPDRDEIDAIMALVNAIKAREHDARTASGMAALGRALADRGAEAIIAGCTEIPLVLRADAVPVSLVASTDVLASKTVKLATGAEPLPSR